MENKTQILETPANTDKISKYNDNNNDYKINKKDNVFKRLWKYFTTYEKCWLLVLTVIAIVMSILLPESDTNGISGIVITIFYCLDVIIGNLCELLYSKQNRWSFMIYNLVELIEIAILIMLRARFASMAVAIFFWIPAHTVSFFNWKKHKDEKDSTKTVVRQLKPWQSVVMLLVCLAWTAGIGYLMAAFGPETNFYSSALIEKIVAYADACLSIISILDGVLMFFRFKEAWVIWYAYIIIETVVNIISGQWILLVYKIGYATNTAYGYICWSKYIKNRSKNKQAEKDDKTDSETKNNIENNTVTEIAETENSSENNTENN